MTESVQLSEDTNIIQDRVCSVQDKHQIANILKTYFLSIGIPTMEDYKDHARFSGIKAH